MATIKKPAKKMQMGGSTKYSLDKAIKDAGFGSKKLSPDMNDRAPNPKSKGRFSSKVNDIDSLLKKKLLKNLESKETLMKKGGVVKAKNGKSFPDLNKDGKITKADILKGRGVIAKKGASIKKAQTGNNIKVNPPAGYTKGSGYKSFGKSGVSVKKMQYGGAAASMVPPMMKKGGATKKCKYGCK
jgi:hypothetical protein